MTGISSQEDYKNTTGIARFVQSNYRSATEGKANEECSDADEDGEQQLPAIGQQLKKNNYLPWMICEPIVDY